MAKKKYSWKIYVARGGKYYFRVHLHLSREAFEEYFAKFGKREVSQSADAVCTCPSMIDCNKEWCVGEINFYYPNIYSSLLAHEIYHAVINYFCMLKVRNIVPPFNYVDKGLSKKRQRYWSQKHEQGAMAMGYMMGQMHDKFIRHKIT